MSVWVARAPGRLDVMGGIADYSGSLVLQWPIRESTTVRVQFLPSPVVHIVSKGADSAIRAMDVPLDLVNRARPPYGEIRAWFAESAERHWGAYVAGVLGALAGECGVRLLQGMVVEVTSEVPEGKGVSSSAALEAATMTAVLGALSGAGRAELSAVAHSAKVKAAPAQAEAPPAQLSPRDQALLCQKAENLVVGAPCGVMDQMAVICGRAGHLMALLCQPAELQAPLKLPEGLAVFGIDSGIRHAVSGSDYTGVRVGAFMGYRILADLAGLEVEAGSREGHVLIDDTRWRGYLANVGSDMFQEYEVHVPNTLPGSVFLKRYGGTTDRVTSVDPDRCYAVWTPTAHPIYEHERVSAWARLLRHADDPARPVRMGELMYQSHASYGACGLGSDGTDLLVDLAREAGTAEGIFGAKITGGGSGGTVAILARADAEDRVRRIASDYAERTGREPYVFEGTSEGAAVTGSWREQLT